jgi:hypothetical protein
VTRAIRKRAIGACIRYGFFPFLCLHLLQNHLHRSQQQLGFQQSTANMALSSNNGLMRSAAPAQRSKAPVRLSVSRAAAVEAVPKTYTGKTVTPPQQGKHFLHLDDFSKDDIMDMLARAEEAKQRLKLRDATFKPFKDMSMAMIFTKPSARTRVSFETVRGLCSAAWWCPNRALQGSIWMVITVHYCRLPRNWGRGMHMWQFGHQGHVRGHCLRRCPL